MAEQKPRATSFQTLNFQAFPWKFLDYVIASSQVKLQLYQAKTFMDRFKHRLKRLHRADDVVLPGENELQDDLLTHGAVAICH